MVELGRPLPTDSSEKLSYSKKLSNVKLDDVGGLEDCKQVLMEAAIWPKEYPYFFTGNRKPWRSVLLFGPPGSGKTLLANAIAAEANFHFSSISPSDIVSKWMGEGEQHVKDLFKEAREKAPSIIFIDEIDSLCGPRGENNEIETSRRIKSELLVHMQGVCDDDAKHVLILAATNTPYALDQAIRRRFDMRIYIPLPNCKARKRIFEVEIGKTPSSINEKELEKLAEGTEGFSGSDISSYVKDALYHSVRATLGAEFFVRIGKEWVPSEASARHKKSLEQLPCQEASAGHKKSSKKSVEQLPCQEASARPKKSYKKSSEESDKKSLKESDKKSLEQLRKEGNSKIRVPDITLDDFKEVSKRHKRTVNEADLKLLEKFDNEFGARSSDPGGNVGGKVDRNVEKCWFLFFIFIIFFLSNRYPYASGFFLFLFLYMCVKHPSVIRKLTS